jgi:hypothetical protein
MIVHAGKKNAVTIRVVLESDEHGREYFDSSETLDDVMASVRNIVEQALKDKRPIERLVAVAIVPVACYGSDSSYGYGLGDDEEFDPMSDNYRAGV